MSWYLHLYNFILIHPCGRCPPYSPNAQWSPIKHVVNVGQLCWVSVIMHGILVIFIFIFSQHLAHTVSGWCGNVLGECDDQQLDKISQKKKKNVNDGLISLITVISHFILILEFFKLPWGETSDYQASNICSYDLPTGITNFKDIGPQTPNFGLATGTSTKKYAWVLGFMGREAHGSTVVRACHCPLIEILIPSTLLTFFPITSFLT